MKDNANPTNLGSVASVRGSVVDIRFDEHLPPIYSLLRAGMEKQVIIEVMAQRGSAQSRAGDCVDAHTGVLFAAWWLRTRADR